MRRLAFVAVAFVLLAVSRPMGQTAMTPLFRMDCGAGGANFPRCGWSTADTSHSALFTRTFVPGVAPGGADAVQITLTPTNSATSVTCDPRMGWTGAPGATTPAQGQSRFVRYKIRYSRVANVSQSADCGGGAWEGKTVIITNSPDTSRSIEIVAPRGSISTLAGVVSKNISGPPDQTEPIAVYYAANTWHSIQWEVRTSTTASSGNGQYKFWRDNNNYSAPSAASAGTTSISTQYMGHPMFLQAMSPLGGGQTLSIQVCCFEYDDQFDPNWHLGGSAPPPIIQPPAAPTSLRIVQ